LWLSRLLLGAAAFGGKRPDADAISSCLALEFLDQALCLGASVAEQGYDKENLLITDYLYGQAIDRVIAVDKPAVIDILAKAIAAAAEDKVAVPTPDYRGRLAGAAFDIALALGEFADIEAAQIAAAKAAWTDSPDVWLERLPDGPAKEYLRSSLSPAVSE